MTGYYYNIHAKVTFGRPTKYSTLADEKSSLNQRIRENTEVLPLDDQDQTHRNRVVPHPELPNIIQRVVLVNMMTD